MEQIGNLYVYETRGGQLKSAVLTGMTKAWYIFSNGDWIERYRPLYNNMEERNTVAAIVDALEKTIHVPVVIHVPNRFLK